MAGENIMEGRQARAERELYLTKQAKQVADALRNARHAVFFGGAGVSTASGVPDFRSATGIYQKERGAEEILTPRFMFSQPEAFYRFYRKYFMTPGIQPNACHRVLADLERRHLIHAVITQNVDALHQAAGSRRVYELHGTGAHFTCTECASVYPISQIREQPLVPRCACGGLLRPDIVLYDEGLDRDVILGAVREIEQADLLIIGGTSLSVYPAAGLIHYQKPDGRKVLVDLNPAPGNGADLTIKADIAKLFDALADALNENLVVGDLCNLFQQGEA